MEEKIRKDGPKNNQEVVVKDDVQEVVPDALEQVSGGNDPFISKTYPKDVNQVVG